MVCLCQSEGHSTRISRVNVHLTQCCRFGQGACNHRCLAERSSLAESNFLRLEEILNLHCIEAIYCPMPNPCLGRVDLENYRPGAAKVFSLPFFILQASGSRVVSSRYSFMMDVLCRHCSGQDELPQRQLVQFRQCHSWVSSALHVSSIPVEFGSKDRRAQNLRFFELPNVETLISGMQPMKLLRQMKGCAPSAACERLRHLKSLFHRRDAL